MMQYAPKTKPIPPPCGRDCPGRAPGCSAMCCSWMLYQSIREHIYQKQLAEKHAQELNFVAQREIAHAGSTGGRRQDRCLIFAQYRWQKQTRLWQSITAIISRSLDINFPSAAQTERKS